MTSPITAPGKTVEITLGPCDVSPGFDPTPGNNSVLITFQPPAGAETDVPASGVAGCTLPAGRCTRLTFTTPSTTGYLPPDGLVGPARVTVKQGSTVLANIGSLFLPTTGCDYSTDPHGWLADPSLAGRTAGEQQLGLFLSTGQVVNTNPAWLEVPIANPNKLECLRFADPQTGQGQVRQPLPASGDCPPLSSDC